MFDTDIEKTIVIVGIILFFAQGWYLNLALEKVHKKLDITLKCFDGLRDYLYEIDPQFDDERQSFNAMADENNLFASIDDLELVQDKKSNGRRTLNTSFLD